MASIRSTNFNATCRKLGILLNAFHLVDHLSSLSFKLYNPIQTKTLSQIVKIWTTTKCHHNSSVGCMPTSSWQCWRHRWGYSSSCLLFFTVTSPPSFPRPLWQCECACFCCFLTFCCSVIIICVGSLLYGCVCQADISQHRQLVLKLFDIFVILHIIYLCTNPLLCRFFESKRMAQILNYQHRLCCWVFILFFLLLVMLGVGSVLRCIELNTLDCEHNRYEEIWNQ